MMALLATGVGWAADTWQETAASALSTGDIVVIVDKTSGMAMSNDKGTSAPPVATEVSFISNQTQISAPLEKIQWEVTVTNGTYKFNVPGESKYLYCTATNNGVRVGTNSNNAFTISNNNNGVPFLYNTATSRYLGVYNNQDWRCYETINNNIKNCVLAFYKKVGPASAVATPVISGTTPFVGTTQVSINCETSGAAIYYTLDGSDPTTSSTLYIDPFTINATTTVKAIAALNAERSNIATKTFTAIPAISSIAEFNDLTTGTNFQYTASNLVYIVSNAAGNNHYVQDGSNGMLIYGNLGQNYTAGDVIPGGFTGTRAVFNTAPEMTNPDGFTASSQSTELIPVEITPSQVNMDNFGRYMIIKNASFDTSTKKITAGGETIGYHTTFNNEIPTDGGIYDVIGVCGYYKPNNGDAYPQFLPISFTEAQTTGPEYYLVGSFNENDGVWVQQDPDYKFTKRADGSYILNDVELAEGVEFKIIKVDNGSTTWYGGTITDGGSYYGVNGNVHNNLPLDNTDNGKNFKLEVAGTNDFVISSDMKLTVNRDAALYIKGSYSNDDWATKTPLTATNDGWTITMDMAADTEFGFVDEWNTWHGGNGYWIKAEHMGTEIPIVANGNFVMKVASNFTLNINSALTKLVVTDNNAVVEDGYVKVTSANDLTSGTYLIVYEDGNLAFNGGLETLDAVSNSITVTISNNTIPSSAEVDAATFTYDKTAGTFKSASGYYIGQTSDANGLATSATTAYTNDVSIDDDGNANIVSSGGAYLRYNAASNQTRFRYYKSSTYSSQKAIQLYKKSGQNLGAPVIDGETPFLETTTVTITAEDGASIYYTTNGDTPSSASTLYQAPFQLTETTTVKAIAVKDEASSAVATKIFVKTPQVASTTEFYNYEGSDEFAFTGNLVAIAQQGQYLYAQDDAKGVLIFGTIDQNYQKGDMIPAGFHAKKGAYHGAPQMTNATGMQTAAGQATIEPVELTVDQITLDNYARYAVIKNVKYENGSYTVGDATLTIFNRFGVEFTPEEGATYDIVGVSGWYDGPQFMPLEYNKAVETVVLDGVAFTANSQWATYYNSARNLTLPEGVTAYVVTGVQGNNVAIEPVTYIPAGVGVLLYSEDAAEQLSSTLYTGETGTHSSLLVGSDEDQTITEGYVLYNNIFYRSEEGTLEAHRCYLPMTQVAGAPRMLMIGASDVPTAIESIIAQGNVAGIKYVNLSGMTSDEPWRGVNIAVISLTDGTTRTVKVIK